MSNMQEKGKPKREKEEKYPDCLFCRVPLTELATFIQFSNSFLPPINKKFKAIVVVRSCKLIYLLVSVLKLHH